MSIINWKFECLFDPSRNISAGRHPHAKRRAYFQAHATNMWVDGRLDTKEEQRGSLQEAVAWSMNSKAVVVGLRRFVCSALTVIRDSIYPRQRECVLVLLGLNHPFARICVSTIRDQQKASSATRSFVLALKRGRIKMVSWSSWSVRTSVLQFQQQQRRHLFLSSRISIHAMTQDEKTDRVSLPYI